MNRLLRNRFPIYIAAAGLAAAVSFLPTPYSLILPGRAIDLRTAVSISGRKAPPVHLYLTDVRFAPRASAVELLRGLTPGGRIVRTSDVVPRGISADDYEGVEREAMSESQAIAAVVAERAAGFRVPVPRSRVLVVYLARQSYARGVLKPLDMLMAVNGQPVGSNQDVVRALRHTKPGARVRIVFVHGGKRRDASVPTISYGGRAVFGIFLTTIFQRPPLPVNGAFHLPGVAGSSGGLMFALEIYCTLKGVPQRSDRRIAGTGTIGLGGSVGPIEGARQKIIAARDAGATVFFVPSENYADVAGTRGIRVVPIATFAQAVRSLTV